jgi:hypothetical protein
LQISLQFLYKQGENMSHTWGLCAINAYTFNSEKTELWSFVGYRQGTVVSTWPKDKRDPAITALRVIQLSLNTLGYTTLHRYIPTFAGGCRCIGGLVTLAISLNGGGSGGVMAGHFCEEARMMAIGQIVRGLLEINQLQKVNLLFDFCATFYNLIDVGVYCIDYYNRSDTIAFKPEEQQSATEKLIPGPDYPWYLRFLYLA